MTTDDAALVENVRRRRVIGSPIDGHLIDRLLALADEVIAARAELESSDYANCELRDTNEQLTAENESLRRVRDASLAARYMNTDEAIAILDAALDADAARGKP
jgi:hypothetical protein